MLSRALSPAKPLQLYIDDDKRYCVALFDDENLDAAIGRNGMNINLASKITEYKIDGYGVKQYERIQEDQKTLLIDIEGLDNKISTILSSSNVNTVSDLIDAGMYELLKISGMDEELLDEAYEGVQSFIEREIETDDEDDEVHFCLKSPGSISYFYEEYAHFIEYGGTNKGFCYSTDWFDENEFLKIIQSMNTEDLLRVDFVCRFLGSQKRKD